MEALLQFEIAGNKLWRIVALFVVIFMALILGRIAKHILQESAIKFDNRKNLLLATTFTALGRSAVFMFAAFGIAIALSILDLKDRVAVFSNTARAILLTIGIGYCLYWLAEIPGIWFSNLSRKTGSRLDDMMAPILKKSIRVAVVILVLVQIAQILSDKPITSIIAGLGIGGLAVALAAQDSIKNFFGSLVLFVDKPFEIGDRVVIDGHDGPVEEVGLRSTKIRTLDGHLITVPNGELANKTIHNIGKRPYIRRFTNITITYDTPPEKIDLALEIIKELLDNHEGMNKDLPPRVFFNEFNSDSLNIMVIYYYHPPDYWKYVAFSEKFNKELFRRFQKAGIDFAFPTQTIYLAGDPARPLNIGSEDREMSDIPQKW
ncbi:MAG: mechanosensitive ion channel family protein [Deltaproteobacteria bacterium]|nr:mechanosensitive ion channel family protein [Deltaproteobacteria bacterium]